MELVDKTVRYSKNERRAFAVLGSKPLSTAELTEKIYGRSRRPFNDRQVVLGVLTSLAKKAKVNKEDFAIKRSARKGPHPVTFWIEK